MLSLNNLPKIKDKSKKRVGRGLGSRKGAKSGRGTTRHQKAREDIPIHFEGGQNRFVKKFPLLRGKGRNKPKPKPLVLGLEALNKFKSGAVVTIKDLVEKGLVDDKAYELGVKIVKKGELEREKLTLKGIKITKSVAEMIGKKGGIIEL